MLKEIRDFIPMFVATLSISSISCCLITLSLGTTIAGAQLPTGPAAEQFSVLGGFQMALTIMAILFCVPTIIRLAVEEDSRRIALWQVIGASPTTARLRYVTLACLAAIIGCVLGSVLAMSLWDFYIVLIQKTGLLPADSGYIHQSIWAIVFAPITSLLTVVLPLVLTTRSLLKLDPVIAVNGPLANPAERQWVRYLFSFLVTGGMIASYIAISKVPITTSSEILSGLISAYWGIGLGLLLAFGISSKAIVKSTITFIGLFRPFNIFESWMIAFTSAKRRAFRSTAFITPLVLATTSVGLVFGMIAQTRNVMFAIGASEESLQVSPSSQILLIFSTPVILAAASGVLAVYLTNRSRVHDIALLQILGCKPSTITLAAFLESLIYLLVASLISTAILFINSLAMGLALSAGPVPDTQSSGIPLETYILLTAGFLLITLFTEISTLIQSRSLNMQAIVR
ncbi:FtsX-like permease family protein [Arcanobacterium phocae]|uniref:FtsX-like permease family protein n=1 Tax=Arcanobacterium phocae TaxID=131112 RepID=UPI001C103EF7|nr:FtsX-like permease family protein [Arcanobacterium phocae]